MYTISAFNHKTNDALFRYNRMKKKSSTAKALYKKRYYRALRTQANSKITEEIVTSTPDTTSLIADTPPLALQLQIEDKDRSATTSTTTNHKEQTQAKDDKDWLQDFIHNQPKTAVDGDDENHPGGISTPPQIRTKPQSKPTTEQTRRIPIASYDKLQTKTKLTPESSKHSNTTTEEQSNMIKISKQEGSAPITLAEEHSPQNFFSGTDTTTSLGPPMTSATILETNQLDSYFSYQASQSHTRAEVFLSLEAIGTHPKLTTTGKAVKNPKKRS